MKIGLHGGKCCGIKTIHGFHGNPSYLLPAKDKSSKDYLDSDRNGGNFNSSFNFFWEEAPQETYGERFDRFISYLERVRHFGLVEVVLITRHATKSTRLLGDTVSRLQDGELTSYEEAVDSRSYDYIPEGGVIDWGQDEWIPFVEERGFKEVSRFPNINSGNTVVVFHLVMNGEYYKNKKEKEKK